MRRWGAALAASRARLGALVLVALGLRLAVAAAGGRFELPEDPWARGYEPGSVAVALAEGRGFSDPFRAGSGPTAVVGPAVPALWSLPLRLLGPDTEAAWRAIVLINCLLSALVVPAVFRLGARVAGDAVGGLAALAWAAHPASIVAAAGHATTAAAYALAVTLVLERLVALEQADAEGRPLAGPAAAAGALLGASLWIEPLLAAPCFAWWCATLVRRRVRLAAAGLALGAFGLALVSPWAARNAAVFERPVLLRSWVGPELLLGAATPAGEAHPPVRIHPRQSGKELHLFLELGEERYVRAKAAEAWELIRSRPAAWLASVAWRYGNFWLGRLHWWTPSERQPLAAGWPSAARGVVHVVPALLAACGLWIARRSPAARVLGLMLLVYPLVYAFTHVEARYRLPIEPTLLVAASIALTTSIRNRSGPSLFSR